MAKKKNIQKVNFGTQHTLLICHNGTESFYREEMIYTPKIFEMFELCMSGQAFKIFRLSSLAQTMNAFIGLLMCSPSFFCCRIMRPKISQNKLFIIQTIDYNIATSLCSAVYRYIILQYTAKLPFFVFYV